MIALIKIITFIVLLTLISDFIYSKIVSVVGWKKVLHDKGTFYFLILKSKPGDDSGIYMGKLPIWLFSKKSAYIIPRYSIDSLDYIKKTFASCIDSHFDKINSKKNRFSTIKEWDGNLLSKEGNRDNKLKKLLKWK